MKRIRLYWNTLRYLRPVQIFGRIAFRLSRPKPDVSPHPRRATVVRPIHYHEWREPSLIEPQIARFLGTTAALATPSDWRDPQRSALWLYNAHYFDDLLARDAVDRRSWHIELVGRWIAENPPGSGIGWAPYPSSLRIVNWIIWLCRTDGIATETIIQSLAVQTRYLSRRLEHHILGNHLFANAKALVFGGLFFDGKEADEWYRLGIALLKRELAEQILADGGHFELSPMYHHIILADMLDLIAIHAAFGRSCPSDWLDVVRKMFGWAEAMTHPDGQISLFNDAAFGVSATLTQLRGYAAELGIRLDRTDQAELTRLTESGYMRMQRNGACVIADVANVGPDYLPAHAHADTLSFELSLDTCRVVVNGGTSEYGTGPERLRQRGTASHSTLMLDGNNSSEVWSGFRVARRSRIVRCEATAESDRIRVEAEHDGYARLGGKPMHSRRWTLTDNGLAVFDRVMWEGEHCIDIFFHLSPDIQALRSDDGTVMLYKRLDNSVVARAVSSLPDQLDIMASSWHPRFGVSLESQSLRIHGRHTLPFEHTMTLAWEPS
ncbi:heparinase II/III family protein [Devosia sediminis]|uniref:Alginate lyase family protein n=1 Tax=Devosia sediminis TaxID=2798801 RepID=A0A934ITX5_9HYPH|nr:heparinase II/III family protein [Devosia sediminis]MBJ3785076.1 alginate lyase family protein [Devosia sediminis]